jgi:hypothetical protein
LVEEGHNIQLVDSEIQGGISGGRWSAHGGAFLLDPEGVSKLEDIISHYNFQVANYRSCRAVVTEQGSSHEVCDLL